MPAFSLELQIGNREVGFFHHAYVLEGDADQTRERLERFLISELDISVTGNPDYWHAVFESFGIDDGRRLKQMHTGRAVAGSMRIFVIEARTLTHEAQNALLKMFEEPSANTHFFLITPSIETLLPTVLSRMVHIVFDALSAPARRTGDFLSLSVADRVAAVKPIVDAKDIAKAIAFVNGLIAEAHAGLREHPSFAAALEDLARCRTYLSGRAPSIKMILEHLALTLPMSTGKAATI